MDDVQALKPTVFCGVPRVYDKLYAGIILLIKSKIRVYPHFIQVLLNFLLFYMAAGIMQKISASGLIRKKLFDFAYN